MGFRVLGAGFRRDWAALREIALVDEELHGVPERVRVRE